MSKRRPPSTLDLQRLQDISPYINFKLPPKKWTYYQTRKVREIFNELEPKLWTVNTIVPLPRGREEKILKHNGYKHSKSLKAIPHRAPPNIIKEVEFSEDGDILTETAFGEYKFVPFDQIQLASNTDDYIEAFLTDQLGDDYYSSFRVVCGNGVMPEGFQNKENVKNNIDSLMERYNGKGSSFKRWKNGDGKWVTNHYKHWLSGCDCLKTKYQQDIVKLNNSTMSANETAKKIMKAKKENRKNEARKEKKANSKKQWQARKEKQKARKEKQKAPR